MGQAAACQIDRDRLLRLTVLIEANIKALSEGDRSASDLGNEMVIEGAAQQRAGRGASCVSVAAAVDKLEEYFMGQGLL